MKPKGKRRRPERQGKHINQKSVKRNQKMEVKIKEGTARKRLLERKKAENEIKRMEMEWMDEKRREIDVLKKEKDAENQKRNVAENDVRQLKTLLQQAEEKLKDKDEEVRKAERKKRIIEGLITESETTRHLMNEKIVNLDKSKNALIFLNDNLVKVIRKQEDELTTYKQAFNEEKEKKTQAELDKNDSVREKTELLHELNALVSCSVCLKLPRGNNIPICRNGHITCEKCFRRRRNCRICRVKINWKTAQQSPRLALSICALLEYTCIYPGCGLKEKKESVENHETQCKFKNARWAAAT